MGKNSEKLYGKSPKMERNEESGEMEVKKPENKAPEKNEEVDGGFDGMPVDTRHAHERRETKHRHMHEHMTTHHKHEVEHSIQGEGHKGAIHERHAKEIHEMHKRHHEEVKTMHSRHEKEHGKKE